MELKPFKLTSFQAGVLEDWSKGPYPKHKPDSRKESSMEQFVPSGKVEDIAHNVSGRAICDIETVLDGLRKVTSVPFMSNKITFSI